MEISDGGGLLVVQHWQLASISELARLVVVQKLGLY